MKRLALVVALASASAGCAHKQLTNRQVAAGAVAVVAVVGLVVLLSLQCDQLTSDCR